MVLAPAEERRQINGNIACNAWPSFLRLEGNSLKNDPLDALFEKMNGSGWFGGFTFPSKYLKMDRESSPSPQNGHFESKGRAEGRSRNFQILRSLGQDLDFRKCSGWSRPRPMADGRQLTTADHTWPRPTTEAQALQGVRVTAATGSGRSRRWHRFGSLLSSSFYFRKSQTSHRTSQLW